ncbi:MAG: MaoC/PaaZ C-terminal domain-containing protein [Acidimicrobiia bacterium]
MPIEAEKVRGAELPEVETQWTEDQVILYHLGIGAGDPPTEPSELSYVYEANLKVLPTFATIPPFMAMMGIAQLEGLDINPALLLHGEHEIEVSGPLPPKATATHRGRVAGLYDKGRVAVLVTEVTTLTDGEPLFVNRASLVLRGEGGFGGDKGPATPEDAPKRPPDHETTAKTLPQQALLYRLSGDRNPLHADPAFAALGGFDRPILHGLATYGIVCKAVVDTMLEGDVGRVSGYRARFSGVVFPGETIVTRMWDEGNTVRIKAHTAEREETVLSHSSLTVRP